MLKRSSIDKYIRNATVGLPNRERIDTAAEMRVHLNQKTRDLMAQGFPKEEAEHLAVQEMGPVSSTNRALLGHMFTNRLGWWVLATMGIVALGWTYLERDWIFWKDTTIRQVQLNGDDLQFAMQSVKHFSSVPNFKKFEFVVPRGTRTVEYAMVSRFAHRSDVIFHLDCGATQKDGCVGRSDRPLDRIPFQISLIIGGGERKESEDRFVVSDSGEGGQAKVFMQALKYQLRISPPITTGFLSISGSPRDWSAYPKTPSSSVGIYGEPSIYAKPLVLNEWVPLWSAKLGKRSRAKAGSPEDDLAAIDEVVVAVRASSKPINELKPYALRAVPHAINTGGMAIVETDIKKSEMSCPDLLDSAPWTCRSKDPLRKTYFLIFGSAHE